MYHVASYFDVPAERSKDFIAAALANGRDSIATEKGTIRFELIQDGLIQDGQIETRFWLNEAYSDRDAFERVHKNGPHFKTFFSRISGYAKWPDAPIITGNTIADNRTGSPKSKPKGSGYFALAAGIAFLAAFIGSLYLDRIAVDPYVAFQGWLVFAAVILIGWGARRIFTGDGRWTVGQATLNFVVGVIAATIGLLALVVQAIQAH